MSFLNPEFVGSYVTPYRFIFLQVFIIISIGFIGYYGVRCTVTRVEKFLSLHIKSVVLRYLDMTLWEILYLLYIMLLLSVSLVTMNIFDGNRDFLKVALNLVIAWSIIRMITGSIQHSAWARFVGVMIWIFTALNILDVFQSTRNILELFSFEIGALSISLFTVFRGIIIFTILYWLTNFCLHLSESLMRRASKFKPADQSLMIQLMRFFMYVIMIIFGGNLLGIDFSTLAIFSGAFGFGLGFGLKKIFANLVSGFILLMDKSVQAGDIITVGDTFGEVASQGIRYLTVITRDGKKHLIPNEEMIAQRVENWSFQDSKIRLRIPVGVSYDSDIKKVQGLLFEAAIAHPRVLGDPCPTCLLTGFGESSVNFEIRAWIDDPMKGVGSPKSEIMFGIWQKFKENNIQIPFPQRDVHIRN